MAALKYHLRDTGRKVTSQITAAILPCMAIYLSISADRLCFYQPGTMDIWVYISFPSHV